MHIIQRACFIVVAAVVAVGLMAANAIGGTRTQETWTGTQRDGTACVLEVNLPANKNAKALITSRKGCRGPLKRVKTIRYKNGKPNNIVLRGDGGVWVTLKRTGDEMTGKMNNGRKISFTVTASSSSSISVTTTGGSTPTVTITIGTGGLSATITTGENCVRYASNQRCIKAADAANPNIPTFQTINMKVLSKAKIFPFSGGNGFAKSEEVTKGSCRQVKRCERAFNSTQDWCEIVLSDGFFTGWVKRKDDNFVYLRKGC